MTRELLIEEFYRLSPIEQYRIANPQSGPSQFYQHLAEHGYLEKNGVYHMPSIFFSFPEIPDSGSFWDKMDNSPYQALFRMKKATRFSKEPLSYADFISIRYVYSGEDQITTPSSAFTLKKNDICLMNAGFISSQYLSREEDVVFTFMFEKECLVHNVIRNSAAGSIITRFIYDYVLDSKNPKNYIIFHGNDNDKLARLIEDVVMEYIQPTDLGEILLRSYLQILLVEMTYLEYEFEQSPKSLQAIRFAEILHEIEEHFDTVSLHMLSKKYGYNADYISRKILKLTGKTFKDYLLEQKMRQIRQLLKSSSLPVLEIMRKCGFSSETYFYKKFRELYHMTPNEYRIKETSGISQ